MIDFFPKEHISCSSKKRFGVCDVPAAEEKAYIAEREGENWIAVVDNYYQSKVNRLFAWRTFSQRLNMSSE